MRKRLPNDLLLIDILACLLIFIITLFPSNALRIALGVPFILFFPGYVLIAALFPNRSALGNLERIALSLGFSVALVSLLGLLLNYTPWGVSLYPILIAISIFIVATSAGAWLRRRGLPATERFIPFQDINWKGFDLKGQSPLNRALSIVLIVAIVGALGTLGYAVAAPKVGEKFTEFYILGLQGKAIDYPVDLKPGEQGKVIVGIINNEHEAASYRVKVTIGEISSTEIGNMQLRHEEKWEQVISFTPTKTGSGQKVEFLLYKNGADEPYLKPLYLWINVESK